MSCCGTVKVSLHCVSAADDSEKTVALQLQDKCSTGSSSPQKQNKKTIIIEKILALYHNKELLNSFLLATINSLETYLHNTTTENSSITD